MWASRWRIRINRESVRRDEVAQLIAKRLEPAQEFTCEDYSELVQRVRTSSIGFRELREDITGYLVQ